MKPRVRDYLLEDSGGDTLRRDGTLGDADLLDGRVVLALVVGGDHHHNAGLHRDNLAMLEYKSGKVKIKTDPHLVESLDVGGRPVVSDGDDLRISKLHDETGADLGQTLDKLLGHSSIP